MVTKPKIGFIGLGNMGFPMAGHIAGAGYSVTVYDEKPDLTLSHSQQHGTRNASSLTELAKQTELVITMLPDITVVTTVLFGPSEDRLIPGLAAGSLLVDMSSSDPVGTRELGRKLSEHDIFLVDAPVSGGVPRAKTAELTIMAGGEKSQFKRAEPVLETMGKNIFQLGQLGNGQAMKALNNLCSAAGLLIASEVLIAAMKFGLDSGQVVDVLNSSTGRNNSTENKLKPHILSGSYSSEFSLPLMVKDLTSAVHVMEHVNASSELAKSCLSLWRMALTDLGGPVDHTEIARWVDENSDGGILASVREPKGEF